MADLSVRGLDDEVHAALRERARRGGRSMEAEIRLILTGAVSQTGPTSPFLRLTAAAQAVGGTELELPSSQHDSKVDFSTEAYS